MLWSILGSVAVEFLSFFFPKNNSYPILPFSSCFHCCNDALNWLILWPFSLFLSFFINTFFYFLGFENNFDVCDASSSSKIDSFPQYPLKYYHNFFHFLAAYIFQANHKKNLEPTKFSYPNHIKFIIVEVGFLNSMQKWQKLQVLGHGEKN